MTSYKNKTGFYRSHRREDFQEDNLALDPKTGELIAMPSMTKQSFVEQCDINNILKQYKISGMLQHVSAKAAQGQYQDLPDEIDFQESMNTVLAAQNAFATLPSKLRNRFENDPAQFLEFMADPKNRDEAITLGLIEKPAPAEPPAVPQDETPPKA